VTHAIACVLAVAVCVWEAISAWRWHQECRRIEQRLARDLETIDRNFREEVLRRLH